MNRFVSPPSGDQTQHQALRNLNRQGQPQAARDARRGVCRGAAIASSGPSAAQPASPPDKSERQADLEPKDITDNDQGIRSYLKKSGSLAATLAAKPKPDAPAERRSSTAKDGMG